LSKTPSKIVVLETTAAPLLSSLTFFATPLFSSRIVHSTMSLPSAILVVLSSFSPTISMSAVFVLNLALSLTVLANSEVLSPLHAVAMSHCFNMRSSHANSIDANLEQVAEHYTHRLVDCPHGVHTVSSHAYSLSVLRPVLPQPVAPSALYSMMNATTGISLLLVTISLSAALDSLVVLSSSGRMAHDAVPVHGSSFQAYLIAAGRPQVELLPSNMLESSMIAETLLHLAAFQIVLLEQEVLSV